MSLRLEKSLRDSTQKLPAADLNTIIFSDISKMEKHDSITCQEITSGVRIGQVLITSVFSAVLIVGIYIWLTQSHTVYSIITLDINAGFIITADSKGTVLTVRGVDEAARLLLRYADSRNIGITELSGLLVTLSAELNYYTEENNYILISVWDNDYENCEKLLASISEQVYISAKSAQVNLVVLGQYLENEGALEQDAEIFGVTEGMFQLIKVLQKNKPAYTTEQLIKYNIERLLKIARVSEIDLPVTVYYSNYTLKRLEG